MSSSFTKKDYLESLRKLDIPSPAVLLVSTSFFGLGRLEGAATREAYAETLCGAIREAFGEGSTILGNTYTTDIGRSSRPFVAEDKNTTTGIFNDWLLNQSGAVRSLHPLNSVTALGPAAEDLCLRAPRTNYGIDTPHWRFAQRRDAWILRVGIWPFGSSVDHLAEAVCGVPYQYNKQLDVSVRAGGKTVEGPWTAVVRYLHLELKYDFFRVEELVRKAGLLRESRVGAGALYAYPAKDYFDLIVRELSQNPFLFMGAGFSIPPGKIPRDGSTKDRDGVRQKTRPPGEQK